MIKSGLFAVVLCVVVFMLFRTSDQPTMTEVEPVPRAQLFAQLDPLFAAIEAKSKTTKTVTGTPPYPVAFSFEREQDARLGLTARAGMREVAIRVWLEDGDQPGTTRLNILYEPEAIYSVIDDKNALRALETVLGRIDSQFIEGQRITALFGGHAIPPK